MPTGDSLTIIWGLLLFGGGTAVTAYAAEGRKGRNLWIAAGIMVALAVAYGVYPTNALGTPAQLLQRLMLLIPLLSAALVIVTVRDRRQAQLPSAAPGGTPIKLSAIRDQEQRQQAMKDLMLSQENARVALLNRDEGSVRNALPNLRSTLLTLQKTFDLRTPMMPDDARPRRRVQAAERYLREIGAMLRQGHIEEARQRALEIVPGIDDFVSGSRNDLP